MMLSIEYKNRWLQRKGGQRKINQVKSKASHTTKGCPTAPTTMQLERNQIKVQEEEKTSKCIDMCVHYYHTFLFNADIRSFNITGMDLGSPTPTPDVKTWPLG